MNLIEIHNQLNGFNNHLNQPYNNITEAHNYFYKALKEDELMVLNPGELNNYLESTIIDNLVEALK